LRLGCSEKGLDPVGNRNIIGIHRHDPLATGSLDRKVSGPASTSMGSFDASQTGILFSQTPEDFWRAIGRSIVDRNQLKPTECLFKNATDSLLKILLGIVYRHDHGNKWTHRSRASSRLE
jgi:hypothetical protein